MGRLTSEENEQVVKVKSELRCNVIMYVLVALIFGVRVFKNDEARALFQEENPECFNYVIGDISGYIVIALAQAFTYFRIQRI